MIIDERLFSADLEVLSEEQLAARLIARALQLKEETNRVKIGIMKADIRAIEALVNRRGYNSPERGKL